MAGASGSWAVQGPGLGWHGDYLQQNPDGSFAGIGTKPQPGMTYPGNAVAAPTPTQPRIGYDPAVFNPVQNQTQQEVELQNTIKQKEAEQRSGIEGAYGNYFGELDNMLVQGLPGQKTAQENIVRSQQQGAVSSLEGQKTQGLADLGAEARKAETSKAKSLKDVGTNLENMWQAGNVKLGTMGAGDSSAVNQYKYAISKLGSKARGDVMSQYAEISQAIDDKRFKLENIFNTEVNRLQSETDQKVAQIAQWFYEAQDNIRQMKAQGQISKAQDLSTISQNALQFAQQQLLQVQTDFSNRRSALEQWVASRSENLQQLAQNMAGISQYQAPNIATPQIQGLPRIGGVGGGTGFWSTGDTEDKRFLA